MKWSKKEVFDLGKAWVAISIAFAILLRSQTSSFLISLGIAAVTVGVGFLLHELGHKVVAQYYGYKAEFKSFDIMLLVAIALSFFGFIFAAPGAVFFQGHQRKDHEAHIAAMGPLINIILAIIFLFIPGMIGSYGTQINSWLAVFNLIPLGPFDGRKVLEGNKILYGILAIGALALLIFL